MPLEEPGWWYGPENSLAARLLAPAARVWGHLAERRWSSAKPYRSRLPVICVGNFTAGGTGKTPMTAHLADLLKAQGRKPTVLTRGFGGRARGPHWVDPGRDVADLVGDEPLLLARHADVLVARDRAAGARAIEAAGDRCDVIVMDDGLQNPSLAKDLAFAVVDGRRGLGNGRVMPAGPLRAPIEAQFGRVDAVVINGSPAAADDPDDIAGWFRRCFAGPVLMATVAPVGDTRWLAEKPIVAYAGIGSPARFFELLGSLGASLAHSAAFPDHHGFTEREASRLLALARAKGATLVTTEKDWVRLQGTTGARAELQAGSRTLAIAMSFEARDQVRLASLLEATLRPTTRPPRV